MSVTKREGHAPSQHERSNNMIAINILLGIVAAVLLLFVVGTTNPPQDKVHRLSCALAFLGVVALIIALNIGG